MSRVYWQHEYAVQVFTGSVPEYDQATGNKIPVTGNPYFPYQVAATQIVCDTIITVPGHFDPRAAVKLATTDDAAYTNLENAYAIKKRRYYGGTFTGLTGPIGTAPSFYGRNSSSAATSTNEAAHDGIGRWLYRDDAPYILMTYAELKFCTSEALWKLNRKGESLQAFKDGVKADLEFTGNYILTGKQGKIVDGLQTTQGVIGGDKLTKAVFTTMANEYSAGPYVDGLTEANFTLSHITMQKWVALYPWGASEA
ncbi:MAG: SusD/RagB family nutrient-binding outer membrane lipoprotein [Bacteroidales bacterium]|nr:SusD/RagB family nutrient-binding outer membrane lipoprotein [Bacteroidales bacterium]